MRSSKNRPGENGSLRLLDVVDASKDFDGLSAVSNMSLSVDPGETLAIIGPNGAGKSTFFGLIAGEHRGSSGRIIFNGEDITRWPAHRRARAGISRTFQVARLFPTRTVREHLHLALVAKRGRYRRLMDDFERSSCSDESEAASVLTKLGLGSLGRSWAGDLAQGDRKRLEFAMAMIQKPRLLLLDEPTAGMSNEDCDLTVELLRAIRAEDPELAIVMTGHDMHVLLSLAHRVVLMADGQMLLDGSPSDVSSSDVAKRVYLGGDDV